MSEYKTPGVYIREKNAFGNSVVEAETAIPAFIGYTEKAENGNDELENIPWKISSMTEFVKYFGGAPELKFDVDIKKFHPEAQKDEDGNAIPKEATLKPEGALFQICVGGNEKDKFGENEYEINYAFSLNDKNLHTLYYQMQMFFANGGGTCYVVSVGSYGDGSKDTLNDKNVEAALAALEKIQEVTMIIVPEAVESDACANIQQLMMKHCGEMGNRFAILDVPSGAANTPLDKRMEAFQNTVTNYFSYGAAYFPWLNTSVLSERDLNGEMFSWSDNACAQIEKFTDPALVEIVKAFCWKSEELELKPNDLKEIEKFGHTFKFGEVEEGEIYADADAEKKKEDRKTLGKIEKVEEIKDDTEKITSKKIKVTWLPSFNLVEDKQAFHQALSSSSVLYKQAIKGVLAKLNLLPPSAAMAGIYTMVDRSRGVWKAPANVTLNYVNSVTEDIDDDAQANLNAPMNGKAVNVIRPFRGEGIKVWGARTLDGNSLDWRYINVRRTLLFLEESVKNAARAYVFEPNDAGTWINMKCMIENFLRSVWKRGGLAGATPEDAYEVHVGLGDTMTAEDILEGIMRITVLVAISRPAEFIEITFQQQMQKS